jgi:uncharacterized membrane protein YuzA (DUF378 family)
MRFVDILALFVVLAAGLNSGMVAYCSCDVLELTFGYGTAGLRVAHGLIGASALYLVAASRWIVRRWGVKAGGLTDSFMAD